MTCRFDDLGNEQLLGARDEQQDYFALTDLGDDLLVVLADGMGGHAGGALASELAVKAFVADCRTRHRADPGAPLGDLLAMALEQANQAIADGVVQHPQLAGMGATLIAALLRAGRLYWVSVGDSLLYHWRDGAIERLNADHSLGAELDQRAGRGEIGFDEAMNDPRRHVLRSALTGDPIPEIDLHTDGKPLESDDRLLLASDGIATLSDTDIGALLGAHGDAAGVAAKLMTSVEAAADPYQDNCTLVTVFGTKQKRQPWWRSWQAR
jgi:protein phosphatase